MYVSCVKRRNACIQARYVEVWPDGVQAKVKALSMDRGVMRSYPHPRLEVYITGLAAYRGSQFQLDYAEAFEIVLRKY